MSCHNCGKDNGTVTKDLSGHARCKDCTEKHQAALVLMKKGTLE